MQRPWSEAPHIHLERARDYEGGSEIAQAGGGGGGS
jgi:hypothetical protein